MGLDTSHDCWHGAYGAFNRWREQLAQAAGLPPLGLMEGFFNPLKDGNTGLPSLYHQKIGNEYSSNLIRLDEQLPIKWEALKPDALHELLNHSDCDGEIPWTSCGPIAHRLEEILPNMPKGEAGGHIGNWRDKTQQFIDGLRKAEKRKETVNFH